MTLLSARAIAPSPEHLEIPNIENLQNLDVDSAEVHARDLGFLLPSQSNTRRDSAAEDYQVAMRHAGSAFVYPKFLGDEALTWARTNISPEASDIRFSFTSPGKNHILPHTDRSRSYTMIYLLDAGGPEVDTVFYRRRDNPRLIWPRNTYECDYSNVEEIHRIRIRLHDWTLINNEVLHSVQNMISSRISYNISFDVRPTACTLVDIVAG